MQRFFVSPEALATDTIELSSPELVHQLTRVLRVKIGIRIMLLDGMGVEVTAEVVGSTKHVIELRVLERRQNTAEPHVFVTLFQAIPKKPALFEEILAHGTEVGISRFVPIISVRTEVRDIRNRQRCERILRESAEQSERGIIPTLTNTQTLEHICKNPPTGASIIGDSFGSPPLLSTLTPTLRVEKELNIFVGPEGGFTADEIMGATNVGFQPISLGQQILRTETAGIAMTSAVLFG